MSNHGRHAGDDSARAGAAVGSDTEQTSAQAFADHSGPAVGERRPEGETCAKPRNCAGLMSLKELTQMKSFTWAY